MVLLIVFSLSKYPAFLAIYLTTIFSGVLADITQHDLVSRFASDPNLSAPLALTQGDLRRDGDRFVSTTGEPAIDRLLTRGGMESMLGTVWLILGALALAAIVENAGILDRLIKAR